MAKQKKTNHEEKHTEALTPVSVTETSSTKAKEVGIEVPQGYVYIVGLNEDGSEKEKSGFFYPEKSYKKIYGDETKYLVKKKV